MDAGFLRDPDPAGDLPLEPLVSEPLVVVLPKGHRLAGRGTRAPGVQPQRSAGSSAVAHHPASVERIQDSGVVCRKPAPVGGVGRIDMACRMNQVNLRVESFFALARPRFL
jgi:DNA-binding transcriptional LysR family regulator